MKLTSYINEIDTKLILWVNEFHTSVLDFLMIGFSHKLYPIPLYGFLLFLLFKKYDYKNLFFILIPSIILMIVVADYTASGIFKPWIERLRPCHEHSLKLYLPNGCGGKYGFFSSHASNTFAASVFLFLHLKNKYKYIKLLFIWASITALSRVYLGVHYPTDIITGAVYGSFIGYIFHLLSKKILTKNIL